MKYTQFKMNPRQFEERVLAWAGKQKDIQALIQIGSRVQPNGEVDEWSDWDYQVIVKDPRRYFNRKWPEAIARCWSVHYERTARAVIKFSVVFEGGIEADFVLLAAWQMKLACWAMNNPASLKWLPAVVGRGVYNLQLIASPGYRFLLGGAEWAKRYGGINPFWAPPALSQEKFSEHVSAFWRHFVWVSKKVLRGELRAAQRWYVLEVREHLYELLAEEARLEGRKPRPEARKAERWLTENRRERTAGALQPTTELLVNTLLVEMTLFCEVSRNVAVRRGFKREDFSAIEAWLRGELLKASRR